MPFSVLNYKAMLQALWQTPLYRSGKISAQSVSSAQCDATITSFSFVLPNLTDGSRSHEGISAPHPVLSFSFSFSLHFSVSPYVGVWPSTFFIFFSFSQLSLILSLIPFYLCCLTFSVSFTFPFLPLFGHVKDRIMLLWQGVAVPLWGGSIEMSRLLL